MMQDTNLPQFKSLENHFIDQDNITPIKEITIESCSRDYNIQRDGLEIEEKENNLLDEAMSSFTK